MHHAPCIARAICIEIAIAIAARAGGGGWIDGKKETKGGPEARLEQLLRERPGHDDASSDSAHQSAKTDHSSPL